MNSPFKSVPLNGHFEVITQWVRAALWRQILAHKTLTEHIFKFVYPCLLVRFFFIAYCWCIMVWHCEQAWELKVYSVYREPVNPSVFYSDAGDSLLFCRTIVALVYNVLKTLMEMNCTLFDELTSSYKSDRQRWVTVWNKDQEFDFHMLFILWTNFCPWDHKII